MAWLPHHRIFLIGLLITVAWGLTALLPSPAAMVAFGVAGVLTVAGFVLVFRAARGAPS